MNSILLSSDGRINLRDQDDFALYPVTTEDRPLLSSGILPPITRSYGAQHETSYLAFERPPTQVTIDYYGVAADNVANATLQQFDVWLPKMLYIASFSPKYQSINSIYMYTVTGDTSGTNYDGDYGLLPLTNLYHAGYFCTPPEQPLVGATMAELANIVYSTIWNSNFNTDIVDVVIQGYSHSLPAEIFERTHDKAREKKSPAEILLIWSMMSKEKVLSIQNWTPPLEYPQDVLQQFSSPSPRERLVQHIRHPRYLVSI